MSFITLSSYRAAMGLISQFFNPQVAAGPSDVPTFYRLSLEKKENKITAWLSAFAVYELSNGKRSIVGSDLTRVSAEEDYQLGKGLWYAPPHIVFHDVQAGPGLMPILSYTHTQRDETFSVDLDNPLFTIVYDVMDLTQYFNPHFNGDPLKPWKWSQELAEKEQHTRTPQTLAEQLNESILTPGGRPAWPRSNKISGGLLHAEGTFFMAAGGGAGVAGSGGGGGGQSSFGTGYGTVGVVAGGAGGGFASSDMRTFGGNAGAGGAGGGRWSRSTVHDSNLHEGQTFITYPGHTVMGYLYGRLSDERKQQLHYRIMGAPRSNMSDVIRAIREFLAVDEDANAVNQLLNLLEHIDRATLIQAMNQNFQPGLLPSNLTKGDIALTPDEIGLSGDKPLTMTMNDGPVDTPPAGATPTGLEEQGEDAQQQEAGQPANETPDPEPEADPKP